MTKVDFYVLADDGGQARARMACRLAEKAYGLGHKVHLHTDGEADSQHLDALLWTFRDRSFVPHAIAASDAEPAPVTIGHEPDDAPSPCEVLVNLAREVPAFFSRFERVAEVIDAHTREAGRERYRFYRERGYALSHHDIRC